MISKTDIEIYSEIFQEKSLTEKYLGYANFDWLYSSVKYTADCTLAIPFDLFDKVIVGILTVDDVLSIEQIGEILGMNLTHDPEHQRYKDEAEYDILRIALDNLKDYNMIEIGDTSYSSCRLTKEGKVFAAKGYKFKVEENKPFKLFFDHTSNRHEVAKRELEVLKGKPVQLNGEFDFLDEVLMQNIAEVQVQEIHNPKLGNSFINPKIDRRNSSSFILKIAVALLFDVETKQTRLIAFDPTSKKTNQYFTEFLNINKQDILNLFEHDTLEGISIETHNSYLQSLIQSNAKFQSLLSAKPEDALLVSKKSNKDSDFIDQEYFWLHLKEFVSNDFEEIFLLVPDANEISISKLNQLAEDKETPSLFVVFQQTEDEAVNTKIKQLYQFSTNTDNRLFVAVYREVNSFECLLRNKKEIITLEESNLDFVNDEVHFSKVFYKKKQNTYSDLPSQYSEIKNAVANDYLKIIENGVEEICEEEIEDDTINKKFILEQNLIGSKANAFFNPEINSEAKECLQRIHNTIQKHITGIKNKHKIFLTERLLQLSNSLEANTNDKLENVIHVESKLKEVESECFDEYKDIKSAIIDFKEKVQSEINRIKEEVLAKTYIIDTNVFIKEPDIISKIDGKHYVALSLTVIEELDKLKTIPETKVNASKAIVNINTALKKSSNLKISRVRKARADLTLLPDELQKKTVDNLLLSLGIVYKKHNPTLLTLDRNFQSKAMMLDIPLVTIYELLGIPEEVKEKPKTVIKNKTGIDYKAIFKEMKPNKKGELTLGDFINLIKKKNPDFDYTKLGYETAFKFILSLRMFQITEGKFIKLK
jgi:hypothetical protein